MNPPTDYAGRINQIISDLRAELPSDASGRRNLALAITHLEDALMRIYPTTALAPNPGRE